MSKDLITIGNAGGYWGDDPKALERQIKGGHLDYVSMDFLAEITMSIMQKQKSRDPEQGYALDFVPMLGGVLKEALAQGTTIITNAGGINPRGAARAIFAMAKEQGLRPRIAIVEGDDILAQLGSLEAKGATFKNMETGAQFDAVRSKILAANVYFGALPVARALSWQPDIVITGRVTDTGLSLAPMIYEFGWSLQDWDRLAAGIIAGHLIECGAQVCGGNFSDWAKVKSFHNIGYPLVEMRKDGTFTLTKHSGTGGLVSIDTVREQLFYEMGQPEAYITPDVVADFSSVTLRDAGPDRVDVFGIRGFEPTPFFKVSMAYADGFKGQGMIVISGPSARLKAEAFQGIFWQRLGSLVPESDRETEFVGWNACHRSLGGAQDGPELLLRLGVRTKTRSQVSQFAKLIPSLILSGPPGVSVCGGVPKPQDIVSYWPALLPKELVQARVSLLVDGEERETLVVTEAQLGQLREYPGAKQKTAAITVLINESLKPKQRPDSVLKPLSTIALARSGDKGDTANIGVLARSAEAYAFLQAELTAQWVKNAFQELCHGEVTRYEVPGLWGLNFLLEASLGGGGTKTLRLDAQGKTFAQALLRQEWWIPLKVMHSTGVIA